MSGLADLLEPWNPAGDDTNVWVEIPVGFLRLPTEDIDGTMSRTEAILHELVSPEQQELLSAVVGSLTFLLNDLAVRNTLYCGIGHHLSWQETPISSSLVVSLHQFPEKRNPRLILKDLIRVKAADGEVGNADLVDLEERPTLFFESVRALPRPRLPGQTVAADATSEVYQLEALVPSFDGRKLVALEFSTPYVTQGPQFRAMMVDMAASVSFEPPPDSGKDGVAAKSITHALDGA